MNAYIKIFIGCFIAILLFSCKKVITLKLNNSSPQYIIEGTITDSVGTAKVLISQTQNFYSQNGFVGISGAVVTINNR